MSQAGFDGGSEPTVHPERSRTTTLPRGQPRHPPNESWEPAKRVPVEPSPAHPSLYVLHNEDVAEVDHSSVNGIPVVSVAKAIRQAHEHHLRSSLVHQAIEDAEREGWLRRGQADQLRGELLGRIA
jgi:hypothetical protein